MNKAFIFDMDGVLVNSEPVWEQYEKKFLSELIGQDRYLKIKDQILGNSVNEIYKILCKYNVQFNKQEYLHMYDDYAKHVYAQAKLTNGIEAFIEKLIDMNFKLGLVSSSRKNWIDLVLEKLKKREIFQYVLSLNDTENMRPKPFPDGYITSIKILGAKPNTTIILEDSNRGIKAAKASGALTICLQENLPKGYLPEGADIYTKTIIELTNQIESIYIYDNYY